MISTVVPYIITLIVLLQLYFFFKNKRRMEEFKDIFNNENSWDIKKNEETGFVNGIEGDGNNVFMSIKDSINKYLENNSGSVIDFQLLKDAVDRHSDSVEDDINTQTPVPLYCGLAGTMAGVILGLFPLIQTGALIYLLSGDIPSGVSKETMDIFAANGINELLTGVAWAMIASICGILLTTLNSLMFKHNKLAEESGKNSFLAWMQSSLLPELPSDTSDALNKLVKNLNRFNNDFAQNTAQFRSALVNVNDVYHTQDEIIKNVREMDVMKMARANVKVLEQLQSCTDEIQQFSNYLTTINEYTDKLKEFTDKFDSESQRLHVLEEIRQFFERHKGEISKEMADSDDALNQAFNTLKETSEANITEFKKQLTEQSDSFKEILKEEKNSFEEFAYVIKAQFSDQLQHAPMLEKNLKEISEIPKALDRLVSRIEQSNSTLAANVTQTMNETAHAIATKQPSLNSKTGGNSKSWMKWSFIAGMFIITISSVATTTFTVINTLDSNKNEENAIEDEVKNDYDIDITDSIPVDTMNVIKDSEYGKK